MSAFLVMFCGCSAVICLSIFFYFVVGSILMRSRRRSRRKQGYRMLCQVGVNSFWLVGHCPFAEEDMIDCECGCLECPAYRRHYSHYCPAVIGRSKGVEEE